MLHVGWRITVDWSTGTRIEEVNKTAVKFQTISRSERLATVITRQHNFAVNASVLAESAFISKLPLTFIALEWLFSGVNSFMSYHALPVVKSSRTVPAFQGIIAGRRKHRSFVYSGSVDTIFHFNSFQFISRLSTTDDVRFTNGCSCRRTVKQNKDTKSQQIHVKVKLKNEFEKERRARQLTFHSHLGNVRKPPTIKWHPNVTPC
jgi:hypothetical protein